MKVAICTPVFGDTKAIFTQSLADLIIFTLNSTFEGPSGPVRPDLKPLQRGSSNVAANREWLADQALGWGAEWILWADADHGFPPDALCRLLARAVGFIGLNYRQRDPDVVKPAVWGLDGKPLFPRGEGIEEVLCMGLGFVLVHASVIKAIKPPRFRETFDPNGGRVGEDVYFCRQARAAGFSIFVDHGIEIGHVAETVLTFPR